MRTDQKVALVSIYNDNTKGIPPLGPLYLATALKKNNFEAKIIHKNAANFSEIEAEIEEFKPDLVGMSVFTGYLNKRYVELSRNLKRKGYLIAWGNAHASLVPKQVLSQNFIDFAIIGEGEETLVDLVRNLGGDDNCYKKISGLGFKDKDGRIIINKKRDFMNIDDYLIDWSLIDLERYIIPYFSNRYDRVLAVTTSRGCPFNCQFCYNLVFNRRRWRGHSAEKFIANIKPIIEKYEINAIRFLDDNFFIDKERAFKIAEGLNLPYFGDCRVEFVDEEFVRRAKKTKCQEILFGFESGCDRILQDVVKKGTTTKDIVRAVTLLKDSGIMASGSFVFGFPTETKKEYRQTMRFIVKLLEINNNLAFTGGWFLPYPGTGLYEKAKELGFNSPQKLEEWDKFDRWRHDYQMEWLDWDYKMAVKNSRKILHLLALSYKRRIPIARQIFKWRVEHLNFSFPADIYLFLKLREIYMRSDHKNIFHKFIKKLILAVMNLKNQAVLINFQKNEER